MFFAPLFLAPQPALEDNCEDEECTAAVTDTADSFLLGIVLVGCVEVGYAVSVLSANQSINSIEIPHSKPKAS